MYLFIYLYKTHHNGTPTLVASSVLMLAPRTSTTPTDSLRKRRGRDPGTVGRRALDCIGINYNTIYLNIFFAIS